MLDEKRILKNMETMGKLQSIDYKRDLGYLETKELILFLKDKKEMEDFAFNSTQSIEKKDILEKKLIEYYSLAISCCLCHFLSRESEVSTSPNNKDSFYLVLGKGSYIIKDKLIDLGFTFNDIIFGLRRSYPNWSKKYHNLNKIISDLFLLEILA